jgi:hypothetical protein
MQYLLVVNLVRCPSYFQFKEIVVKAVNIPELSLYCAYTFLIASFIQRLPKASPKIVTQQFPISILTLNRNETFYPMRVYGFTEV